MWGLGFRDFGTPPRHSMVGVVIAIGTLYHRFCEYLGTFGGTPNRDPCSLWGLIWGLPRDIGVI